MQIGIDLGASKIESVVLSEDGKEHLREREPTPQSYNETIKLIKKIVIEIERKFKLFITGGNIFGCGSNSIVLEIHQFKSKMHEITKGKCIQADSKIHPSLF